jgi:hypothetical protein
MATRSRTAWWALLTMLAVPGGCTNGSDPSDGGGDELVHPTDTDGEVDADRDDGADVGADADAEDEAESSFDSAVAGDADVADGAEAEAGACGGGWYDPSSGLCWQDPPPYSVFDWNAAMAYCAALELGGYGPGSWHLPTISELRSLIRGCPAVETGGSCGVIDTCLGSGCENDSCLGCSSLGGPGAGGEYWPSALRGTAHWCWSSSSVAAGGASYAWLVYFLNGYLVNYVKTTALDARCVRPGP